MHANKFFYLRTVFLCLVSALCLSLGTASAQQVITLDSSNLGELTAAATQSSYTYTATTNDTISVELVAVSSGLGLQGVILDGGGNLVLAIGNPGNAPSIRESLQVTAGTSYTILVSSSNNSLGEFVLRVNAQAPVEDCEVVVTEALDAITGVCAATGRNQACIGSLTVNASPLDGVTQFNFSAIGDITNIAAIESIQLTPLNELNGTLSTVYMLVQASLPDTLPGQNVAMLLYGDTQIDNTAVTDVALANQYRPMQAFYFTSGIGPSRCQTFPDSGLLIETPQEAVEVTFEINEVIIQLGSTAFLSFSDQQTLDVALLDGIALVSAAGGAQIVSAGQRVRVPVDAQLLPVAPPPAPEPLPEDVQRLPADIIIPSVAGTPTPIAQQTPIATDDDTARPPLPASGPCVLRTFEPDVSSRVRAEPFEDGAFVQSIPPDQTYTVIGRTEDNTWYEISLGWVAAFVTERGGDCNFVPITFIPATPTPLPTATPRATPTPLLPIATDNEFSVIVDARVRGTQHALQGAISAPLGDSQDTVRYEIINIPRSTDGSFRLSIRCDGVGVEFATIFFSDGSTRDCSPTGYNFEDLGFFTTAASFTIGFSDDPGEAYVTWSATLGININSS